MKNDITTAKHFRDDYFRRLGHGMDEHTVISLMISYAADANVSKDESVDIETVLADKEELSRQVEHLSQDLKEKEKIILELENKILYLTSSLEDESAASSVKPKTVRKKSSDTEE